MKKIVLLAAVIFVLGFSQVAFASHVGFGITLNGPYGASWDWQGGSRYELWRVLDDAGYSALANDVFLDVTGGSPSASYHAYKDSFFQAPAFYSELIAEIAGYKNGNRFGWYENGHAGDVGDGSKSTWAEIFSGSDGAGALASFSNPNEIGFWLNPNGVTGRYFFTDTASNRCGTLQAVTFYLGDYEGFGDEYLVAFEDLKASCLSDRDYQDMIVHLYPVPEPASFMLLGIGLMGAGIFKRKKK